METQMKLYQLMGDGIEELWYFPEELPEERIKELYKEWEDYIVNATGEDILGTFEQYMEFEHPEILCQRVFVEEIYV